MLFTGMILEAWTLAALMMVDAAIKTISIMRCFYEKADSHDKCDSSLGRK